MSIHRRALLKKSRICQSQVNIRCQSLEEQLWKRLLYHNQHLKIWLLFSSSNELITRSSWAEVRLCLLSIFCSKHWFLRPHNHKIQTAVPSAKVSGWQHLFEKCPEKHPWWTLLSCRHVGILSPGKHSKHLEYQIYKEVTSWHRTP